MIRWLRGYAELRLCGASPALGLSRLAKAGIPFWALRREDAFSVRLRLYVRDLDRAAGAAARGFCELQELRRFGFAVRFGGLRRRPVLLAGTALAVAAALFLQNFVWFVSVEGLETLPEARLRQALAAEGVGFGTWSPGVETVRLKNRLLARLPELRWIAVNASGCIARVLAAEREPEPRREPDLELVTDVVAARPGVITRMEVLSGFAAAAVGDAVTEGQLLVTGIADWGLHTQATRALAEVWARTLRRLTVLTPDERLEKRYTGREERCVTLIFERKRIKISGNSSIFGTSCDKMIETAPLALPGGWTLPLRVETCTLREYRLEAVPVDPAQAKAELQAAAERLCAAQITGRILQRHDTTEQAAGAFRLSAELSCEELISQTVPVPLLGEDGIHGKTDQRRAN